MEMSFAESNCACNRAMGGGPIAEGLEPPTVRIPFGAADLAKAGFAVKMVEALKPRGAASIVEILHRLVLLLGIS